MAGARETTDVEGEELRPQDLVLDLLGTYVRDGQPVWSGGIVRLLADFGFSSGAARIALARLVNRGLLERVRNGRLVDYTLTTRTERLLAEGDRRIFRLGREEWDGTWTILWYVLPEDLRVERHRLSRRLRFLGFGSVRDGTWIAPRDREAEVAELIGELGLWEYTSLFVGQPTTSLGIEAVVERAWDFGALAERYDRFIEEFSPYARPRRRAALTDLDAFVVRTRLIDRFRRFPFADPELPESLAGRPLRRAEAVETFHAVDRALAESAERYFVDRTRTARRPQAPV
jgi:phenylacetic acid degradation operon negative regulatory protein